MDQLINNIEQYINDHRLIKPNMTIVVGLSGGPDSIFLLHALAQLRSMLNINLVAAHVDHEWRSDSQADLLFCKQQCELLQIPFESAQRSTFIAAVRANGSQEEVGRKIRRLFFKQVQEKHSADLIALGHHADDQVETFFIRLIRGATLTGLTCMKPQQGSFIRPLLGITKQQILDYLHMHNVSYRTDSTNSSRDFLRNRIRLDSIPALTTADARSVPNIVRSINQLQQVERFLDTLTHNAFASVSIDHDSAIHINITQFLALEDVLRQRILMLWLQKAGVPFTPTSTFLEEIQKFLTSSPGRMHQIHHQWRIQKNDTHTWIS